MQIAPRKLLFPHEAIGVDLESKALAGFCQRLKKSPVILVLVKDPLVPSTTIHDVVKRILILESERPRHTEEPTRIKVLSQNLTPFLRRFRVPFGNHGLGLGFQGLRQCGLVDPEGNVAPSNEGLIVMGPVTNPVSEVICIVCHAPL